MNLAATRRETLRLYGGEDGVFRAHLEEYLRYTRLAAIFARATRTDYLSVFQPLRDYRFAQDPSAPESARRTLSARDYLLPRLRELAAKKELPFVDFSGLFASVNQEAFLDAVHVTQDSQEKIAAALFQTVMGQKFPFAFDRKLRANAPNAP